MAVFRTLRSFLLLLPLLVVCLPTSGCNQSSGFVMNESGKTLYSQGQYTAARREFERALIDRPDNPDYAFNVAAAMRKQGDLIGAERMYRHALNLDPRHQPSHHGLADMLVDQGRVAEADTHLQEWADTQPYLAESHVENAWFRRQQGDTAGAEQYLRRALQVDPKHPVAMAQLGDLYEVNGRPDEARAMYQRSLARNPYQAEVKARMAGAMQQQAMRAGPQLAAYSPGAYGPMNATSPQSTQQASYQVPAYGQPTYGPSPTMPMQPAPFQGFASTPQPAYPGGFPSSAASPAGLAQPMPMAPQNYATMMPYNAVQPMPQYQPQPTAPYAAPQIGASLPYNADPAHVPMAMSSVPIVTPF